MKKLPSIALIHGWATEPAIWESVRRQLDSQGYKVTVYEMPGYGSRVGENGNVTFDQIVTDSIKSLQDCELWIGWSLGSMIALEAASRKQTQCKAVLAVCPTAKFCCDAEKEAALIQLRDSVESDPEKAVRRFRRSLPSAKNRRPVVRELMDLHPARQSDSGDRHSQMVDDSHSDGEQGLKNTLLAGLELLSTTDLRTELNKIDAPVRIVCGKEDTIIPSSSGREIHRLIANSTYTTLPCGHLPFLECPQQFMEQLFEFAETIT